MYPLSGNGSVGASRLFTPFKPPRVPPGRQQMPEVRQLHQMMWWARSFRMHGIRHKCVERCGDRREPLTYSSIAPLPPCPHVYDHFRGMTGEPTCT